MSKYIFMKPEEDRLFTFIVVITADARDADYVSTTEMYNKEGFDEIVDALIDLKFNYTGRGKLDRYYNEFDLRIPRDMYSERCHTLIDVRVQYVDGNGETWDVMLMQEWADED